MSVEFLVAGLGKPEPRYDRSPHNAGFLVADKVRELCRGPRFSRDGEAEASVCRWRGRAFLLLKPLTYMNRSGIAVARLVRRESLPAERVIVCYDDLDLPFGQVRLRLSGGAGGHHGMESILEELGTGDFPRIRLGIREEAVEKGEQVDYLLSPLDPDRHALLEEAAERAARAVLDAVAHGFLLAMNRHNRRGKPEPAAGA
ncbi:MAG: aminoacyl-tRNA hydrolase [Acidobacteriota bacterium]